MIEWVSEQDRLPIVAQHVLLATPRKMGEFWDIDVACILIRHEGVTPLPVPAGSDRWPTDYYWGSSRSDRNTSLVSGNGWWASMSEIPLPPFAEHGSERGYDFIRQIGAVFLGQGEMRKALEEGE